MPGIQAHIPFESITIGTVFSGSGLLAIVYLILRQVGPWRKQTTDATDKLIDQLTKRLDKVETQLANERRMNFIEMRRLEARHDAQRSLERHRFNNSDQCLDSLLNIIELSPEKAPEAARRAREKRAIDRQAEQAESAQIHKAELLAVAAAERELDEQIEEVA